MESQKEKREREQDRRIFDGIMDENFPKLMIYNQKIQEAQRIPSRINTKKNIPRHIVVKLLKTES